MNLQSLVVFCNLTIKYYLINIFRNFLLHLFIIKCNIYNLKYKIILGCNDGCKYNYW